MLMIKGICKVTQLNKKGDLSLGHFLLLAYQFKGLLTFCPMQLSVLPSPPGIQTTRKKSYLCTKAECCGPFTTADSLCILRHIQQHRWWFWYVGFFCCCCFVI